MSNNFTFEEFMKDDLKDTPSNTTNSLSVNSQLKFEVSNSIQSTLMNIFNKDIDKIEDFNSKIITHLESAETIKDISDLIGEPTSNESEDEFVQRASTSLREYLLNKFIKK